MTSVAVDHLRLLSAAGKGFCHCELLLDEGGDPVDFLYLVTNDVFEDVTGMVGAAGRTALSLLPDMDREWLERYRRVALGGEEVRLRFDSTLNGRHYDLVAVPFGGPRRFAVMIEDLTALNTTLERLRASEERHREVAVREREVSRHLQQALLPERLAEHPRVRVDAVYRPASETLQVGGDWYDSYRWPGGEIGLMVGDVAGHGLESAAKMGRLRAAVDAIAPHTPPDPAALLDALGGCSARSSGVDYVTASCVVIDPETGTLRHAHAGHPPSVLRLPDGGVVWLDGTLSRPLGRLLAGRADRAAAPRPAGSVALRPGTLLVMYSDGLLERREEDFAVGRHRLEGFLADFDPRVASPAERIADAMQRHSPTEDDVVVMTAVFDGTESVAG